MYMDEWEVDGWYSKSVDDMTDEELGTNVEDIEFNPLDDGRFTDTGVNYG